MLFDTAKLNIYNYKKIMERNLPYGPFLEEWLDVKDYEGYYKVSNYGRVKTMERFCIRNGVKSRIYTRLLKPHIDVNGYCYASLTKSGVNKKLSIHSLMAIAFLNHKPDRKKRVINHIFFDRTFNVLPYIEIITQRENANRKHCNNSSQYTGVHKSHKKWTASIRIDGKSINLGRYTDELEASKAYEAALAIHLKQTA